MWAADMGKGPCRRSSTCRMRPIRIATLADGKRNVARRCRTVPYAPPAVTEIAFGREKYRPKWAVREAERASPCVLN